MFELIDGFLKHKNEMVNYEAARALCQMRGVSTVEMYRPIAGKFNIRSWPLD